MSIASAGQSKEVSVDGIHDMGGTQGWGTVTIPPDEPVFAEPWEAKAFAFGALRPAVRRESRRHAPRHRPPAPPRLPRRRVLRRWLGVETMLVDSGVLAPGAVVARARKLRGEEVDEPADPEPNKPDYQPTAAGSIRQIDAKPRRAGRPRAHQAAHAGHTRRPLHPRTPATSSPSGAGAPRHTPTSSPRTPSTSTPSPSTPRSCGVTMPSPSRSRSTCTTTTWSGAMTAGTSIRPPGRRPGAEALESLLVGGLIDPNVVDGLIKRYETDEVPR